MASSLTAAERETVVIMDDDTDTATISTWQRRVITKLEKNPAATKVEEWHQGTSRGARFCIPANLISFRSKRREGPAGGNAAGLAKARAARQS